MARGKPALWSGVVALPFILGGIISYVTAAESPLFFVRLRVTLFGSGDPVSQIPPTVGLLAVLFGIVLVAIGLYVRTVSTPKPRISTDEELITIQHPSQRVATAKIVTSVPFLLITAYLLFYTILPYVYPTATFLIGLFYFSTGMYRYWSNTLTRYYITDKRVIRSFKFISKVNQEIPLKVRGIQERRSITEALVGLGNVRIASGAGGKTLEVVVRNIYNPSEFANEMRELV
jgi:hypothetical protein